MSECSFRLNGEVVRAEAATTTLLLDTIRGMGRTGTKEGCGVGVCGACTVLVDDLPVSSCIYLTAAAEGRDVWTVEGIAQRAPELVDAFVEHEGMQCGICTPGQVVSAFALALEGGPPDEARIREHLSGNLCRCTGYGTIVESVAAYLAR